MFHHLAINLKGNRYVFTKDMVSDSRIRYCKIIPDCVPHICKVNICHDKDSVQAGTFWGFLNVSLYA